MNNIVFLNGDFLDVSAAKISVLDRGFIFGDGIYEVVPVINSRLVDRQDFWQRFKRSLAEIELELPYTQDDFEKILYKLIDKNELSEGGVYMQVTRGVAPREFKFLKGLEPTIFTFSYKTNIINNPLATSGIEVISTPNIRWKRRDIKSISLLAQCKAKNEAAKNDAYEAIMVEDGFVTEGSSSSVLFIKDNTLVTKPLSSEILPGIRRETIIKLAKQIGLNVELRNFTMDEIYNSDEAFISAATLILLPIIKADRRLINGGKIGKYSVQLRELYAQKLIDESKNG
ncbi:aminotransferase class IV [Campylobacter mucosalis]|uniref:branched-chain-amino-acid transaminase n=1 Tax=Campylobacter mucosalis CCUG 21559 TaxID=1032067 RepID=A0A6G5QHW3_9BACT|nr:aminotransferase class IV [Campylobacter mucosalis]QCD45260.1 D-amino acid aminotransferase [Campylobacter mucosalis CCUG 21559]